MPLSATLCLWFPLPPHALPIAVTAHLPAVSQASFGVGDSLFLVVMALIVFGPKKLPEISRQIGKLMFEFRKASNDFKFQIEEELRASEQADRQKQLQTQAGASQPATPIAMTAETTVSAEPVTAGEATPETAVAPFGGDLPAEPGMTEPGMTEPGMTEPSVSEQSFTAQEQSILPPSTTEKSMESRSPQAPIIQPPATGLPVSSRPPNGAPVAAEAFDEMQANAQEAVRTAAADPSHHQPTSPSGEQPEQQPNEQHRDAVPTHHG